MPGRRRAPTVGDRVTVAFLARRVHATIEDVRDGGRTAVVVTEEDEVLEFALNPATGYFLLGGRQGGARLLFEG